MKEFELGMVINNLSTGAPFIDPDGRDLTARKILVEHLGLFRAESGEEAIRAYSLGQKVLAAEEAIAFAPEELALARKAMDKPLFAAGAVAPVLLALEACK